jgi:hypothetical protein
MQQKIDTPTDDLCTGIPDEFGIFLNYSCRLPFSVTPDYIYICNLFQNLFFHEEYLDDGIFDWNMKQSSVPCPPPSFRVQRDGNSYDSCDYDL